MFYIERVFGTHNDKRGLTSKNPIAFYCKKCEGIVMAITCNDKEAQCYGCYEIYPIDPLISGRWYRSETDDDIFIFRRNENNETKIEDNTSIRIEKYKGE
jgi:hypothetical protein